jgi:hypothetical protein
VNNIVKRGESKVKKPKGVVGDLMEVKQGDALFLPFIIHHSLFKKAKREVKMKTIKYAFKTLPLFLVLGFAVVSASCSKNNSNTVETEITETEAITETETETAPILNAFTGSIAENEVAGAIVGAITVDAGTSSITSITLSGTGNENFAVDTSGNITLSNSAALDYETTTSYTLFAIATSDVSDSDLVDVTISITDVFSPLEIAKMTASNGVEEDYFGLSVAISDDYILVGAENNDDIADNSGSAYLFKISSDGEVYQIDKLLASDGVAGDAFGSSVAISGDYIVVGTGYNAALSGSAYLFKISSDGEVYQIDKLLASDGVAGDAFGSSVAISGDYIVVGTGYNYPLSGAAYLFKISTDNDTVTPITKLTASDEDAGDTFGESVAISGDYIVVGTYGDDDNGASSGSVYLFKINSDDSATQQGKLTASDGDSNDFFGKSVAISGDYIVAGANGDDDKGDGSGAAYLFKIDSDDIISEKAKLTASDGDSSAAFGITVAILGDYIVVGAEGDDDNGSLSGSAYLFKINSDDTVSEKKKLTTSDGETFDFFGSSVAISSDYIVGGALGDDDNGSNSGSAYTIAIEPQNRPYWENYVAEIEVQQNTSDIYTVLTNSINTGDIIVSLSGVDANNFTIVDGVITAVGTLEFASPADSDGDNVYEVTVDLEDAEGKTYSYDSSIKIIV